jgi:hypothetical protein
MISLMCDRFIGRCNQVKFHGLGSVTDTSLLVAWFTDLKGSNDGPTKSLKGDKENGS